MGVARWRLDALGTIARRTWGGRSEAAVALVQIVAISTDRLRREPGTAAEAELRFWLDRLAEELAGPAQPAQLPIPGRGPVLGAIISTETRP